MNDRSGMLLSVSRIRMPSQVMTNVRLAGHCVKVRSWSLNTETIICLHPGPIVEGFSTETQDKNSFLDGRMKYGGAVLTMVLLSFCWCAVTSRNLPRESDRPIANNFTETFEGSGNAFFNFTEGTNGGNDAGNGSSNMTKHKPEADDKSIPKFRQPLDDNCVYCADGVNVRATPTVSLTFLPMMALIAFLCGFCARLCDWCKEDIRIEDNKDIRDTLEASDHLQPFYDAYVQQTLEVYNKRKIRRSLKEQRKCVKSHESHLDKTSVETQVPYVAPKRTTLRDASEFVLNGNDFDACTQRRSSVHIEIGSAHTFQSIDHPILNRAVSLPESYTFSFSSPSCEKIDPVKRQKSGDTLYEYYFESSISRESSASDVRMWDSVNNQMYVMVENNQKHEGTINTDNFRHDHRCCFPDNYYHTKNYTTVPEDEVFDSSADEHDPLTDSGNNNSCFTTTAQVLDNRPSFKL